MVHAFGRAPSGLFRANKGEIMPFYEFRQNNSYGTFDVDNERGISHYVIIEAESAEGANRRALDIGLYFDDSYSQDCSCCGTRWSEAWENYDRSDVPSIYGEPIWTALAETPTLGIYGTVGDILCWVHNADGTRFSCAVKPARQ